MKKNKTKSWSVGSGTTLLVRWVTDCIKFESNAKSFFSCFIKRFRVKYGVILFSDLLKYSVIFGALYFFMLKRTLYPYFRFPPNQLEYRNYIFIIINFVISNTRVNLSVFRFIDKIILYALVILAIYFFRNCSSKKNINKYVIKKWINN